MATPVLLKFPQPFPGLGPKLCRQRRVGFINKDRRTRDLMQLPSAAALCGECLKELYRCCNNHWCVPKVRELPRRRIVELGLVMVAVAYYVIGTFIRRNDARR